MNQSLPSLGRAARAIAQVTFFEILRDKVLYNVFIAGIFLIGLGFLASKLSFIRPERIILDFGHSAISLSCALMAILLGAGLIGREFERRTIHMALARPISRSYFVVGKFLGLCAVITLNWLLFFAAYVAILFLMSSEGHTQAPLTYFYGTLICATILALFQSYVLVAVAILFSTFTTTSLAVIFSIGVYLVGVNISHLHAAISKLGNGGGIQMLDRLVSLLPNLEHFDLGMQLTYGLPIGWLPMAVSILYALVACAVLLFIASALIRSKEV
jgi:ABC-type transport system involved in multi-copper enzyme maturation permease subunit